MSANGGSFRGADCRAEFQAKSTLKKIILKSFQPMPVAFLGEKCEI
jgi:hypothetical protein